MVGKTTTTITLVKWIYQKQTYRDHNHFVQSFVLLTRTLVSQTKSWVPRPIHVGSYLTTATHMNPFELIGKCHVYKWSLLFSMVKCVHKVNGMHLNVKYTCHT